MSQWQEGQDGSEPIYRERLWPGPWPFVTAALIVLPVAVAYGAAFGAPFGWTLALCLTALAWTWLMSSAPVIAVDDRVLRAGRARLPRTCVGDVSALDGPALTDQRRRGDVRAYVVLRPGTTKKAVLVNLQDPQDPHPQWIVQTRHPDRLIAALRSPSPSATPDAAE